MSYDEILTVLTYLVLAVVIGYLVYIVFFKDYK